ncbi:MAG: class I SAM-dependent methyltransferase [Ignavibacteriaceae bacterium]
MNNLTYNFISNLVCPDDSSELVSVDNKLMCSNCKRKFNIWDNIIELMPQNHYPEFTFYQSCYEENYFKNYYRMFNEEFHPNQNAKAWGSEENISKKQFLRKKREVSQIIKKYDFDNKIICDISSGAGWFTLNVSNKSKLIINCDISVSNINYVVNKSKLIGIANLLLIRTDYFKPPFKENTFDVIFCTDTLAYGNIQTLEFLKNIYKTLKKGGAAIVDFYNRLHRNPFHKPYMTGYTKSEAENLIEKTGFRKYTYEGFYQEFKGKITKILPATRHIFYLIK